MEDQHVQTLVAAIGSQLKYLELGEYARDLSEATLLKIVRHCPNLTTLNVYENPEFSDSVFKALAYGSSDGSVGCPLLKTLDVGSGWFPTDYNGELTNKIIRMLAAGALPGLTKLGLRGHTLISDEELAKLKEKRPSIEIDGQPRESLCADFSYW